MRRLILHIGAHKTGSTAIQAFMYKYADYFEKNYQLLYPIKDQLDTRYLYVGQHFLTWYYTARDNNYNTKKLTKAHDTFISEYMENNQNDVIVSSEDFTWNTQIEKFIDECKNYVDKIEVILYVRKQIDAAISLYQTGIVNHGVVDDFNTWFEKSEGIFDYFSLAEKFEKNGCKINVQPFLRSELEGGDVILDFLKVISIILDKEIKAPKDYQKGDINVNITVPDFITKMIYYYNMQASRDLVVPELRKLGELLMKNDKTLSKYNFLSSNVKPIIREKYINSNRKLCEKYLDEKFLLWLNSEVKEEKTTLYSYNGADIVELSKAVNKILTDLPSEN